MQDVLSTCLLSQLLQDTPANIEQPGRLGMDLQSRVGCCQGLGVAAQLVLGPALPVVQQFVVRGVPHSFQGGSPCIGVSLLIVQQFLPSWRARMRNTG